MIILFEDGSKFELKAWNKFNCKGNSYMSMLNGLEEKMRVSKPTKIRITNGSDYKSYTSIVEGDNLFYFQDILNSLDKINKRITK